MTWKLLSQVSYHCFIYFLIEISNNKENGNSNVGIAGQNKINSSEPPQNSLPNLKEKEKTEKVIEANSANSPKILIQKLLQRNSNLKPDYNLSSNLNSNPNIAYFEKNQLVIESCENLKFNIGNAVNSNPKSPEHNVNNLNIFSNLQQQSQATVIQSSTPIYNPNENKNLNIFIQNQEISNNNTINTVQTKSNNNTHSKRKCLNPEKAESFTKTANQQQIDFLSTKRNKMEKERGRREIANPDAESTKKNLFSSICNSIESKSKKKNLKQSKKKKKHANNHHNIIKENNKDGISSSANRKNLSKVHKEEEYVDSNSISSKNSSIEYKKEKYYSNNNIMLKEEEMISSKYNKKDFFNKKKQSSCTLETLNNIFSEENHPNNKKYNNNNLNTIVSNNSSNYFETSNQFNLVLNQQQQPNKKCNDSKINTYFKQTNKQVNNSSYNYEVGNNGGNNNTQNSVGGNSNIMMIFNNNTNNSNYDEKYSKLIQENHTLQEENKVLKQELEELKNKKADKEIEFNNLKCNHDHLQNNLIDLKNELDTTTDAKDRATESLVTCLRELEEMKRAKQKEWVNSQSFRIGKFRTQSHGMGISQIWEDGVEIKQAKLELEEIIKEKEEEKKMKKKIGSNNYDKLEVNKFKIEMLNKSESDIKDKLIKLYKERVILESEEKRLNEENKCNYAKKNWPILNNRYLILSLIGKGGYSEVYKAYDLINHIHVACKVHQLDQSWSEGVKELYIRHTIRENQIHQKINHEKVVKHYDTVEIDNNSFSTVLEQCTGPDLSFYLKQNGHLSEREAKIIIKQIIIGLKELHSLGIIHYDLKPQNIIFHKGEVKISDFGLAKEMADKEKIELTCLGVGTYYYLPPETFDPTRSSMIDQKVDIWSVGVIFYELLYGTKPFGHNMSQERILKDNLIWNSKPLEFPTDSKINVSKEIQVSLFYFNYFLLNRISLKDACQKM